MSRWEGGQQMDKISVIVPIYNTERYLRSCVESVCCQTCSELEILLIDDGSTDSSGDLCDEYAGRDKRIRVIHRKNGGLSAARNTGIEVSTGNWLTFVDADDILEKGMIERLYRAAKETNSDIAIAGFQRFQQETELSEVRDVAGPQMLSSEEALSIINRYKDEEAVTLITAWGKLYRRELFTDLRYPEGKWHEDEFLAHHLLGGAKGITLLPERLYFYRQRPDSFMGQDDIPHRLLRLTLLDALSQRVDYDAMYAPQLVSDAVHHLLQMCNAFYGEIPKTVEGGRVHRSIVSQYQRTYMGYFRFLSRYEKLTGGLFCLSPAVYSALIELRNKWRP